MSFAFVERRVATVDPDPNPHLEILGPRPPRSSRWMVTAVPTTGWGRSNTTKNSSAHVDHLAGHGRRGGFEDRPHLIDELTVAITQAIDQGGGTSMSVISIVTKPDGRCTGSRAEFTELALRLQLTGDEPDRHDPVLLGCVQQSFAGALARPFVFEVDLAEASKGVADVGLVVNRSAGIAHGNPTYANALSGRSARFVESSRAMQQRYQHAIQQLPDSSPLTSTSKAEVEHRRVQRVARMPTRNATSAQAPKGHSPRSVPRAKAVAQHHRFELELIEALLHHVADRDDPHRARRCREPARAGSGARSSFA